MENVEFKKYKRRKITMSEIITVEEIHFPFVVDKTDPEVFFTSLQSFFQGMSSLQKEIIKKADPQYEVEFKLRQIDSGSLRAWFLKKIIVPDDKNGNLDLSDKTGDIESYSNDVEKSVFNNIIEKKDDVIGNTELININKEINSIAKKTKVSEKVNFKQPNVIVLLESVQSFQKVANGMDKNFTYEYKRDNNMVIVPRFYLDCDKDKLIAQAQSNIKETRFHTTYKFKQVDFLGHSKWHFKLDSGETIEAKIVDESWLNDFHARKYKIGSGDSIDVEGVTRDINDEFGNIISTEYIITKVNTIVEKSE